MRTRLGLVAGAGLMLFGGLRVATASFLIDDFATGAYGLVNPPAQALTAAASVVGGDRMTNLVQTLGLPAEITLGVFTGPGNMQYGSFNGADGFFQSGYGYTGAFAVDPLNINLSSWDQFHLDFTAADFGTTGTINVIWNGVNSATSTVLGIAGGPGTWVVPFNNAGFAGVDWTDIDQVTFRIEAPANGDYTITNFHADIPEPSSLALLGLFGLVGGLIRRRRS